MNEESLPITNKRKSLIDALTSPSNNIVRVANKKAKTADLNVDTKANEFVLPVAKQSFERPPLQKTPEKSHAPLISSSPAHSKRNLSPFTSDKKVDELTDRKSNHPNDQQLQIMRGKSCIFNDPIHGNITMSGLCLRIIDTKEFQRLRNLKQLGTCDYVFPGATHSRFSHSIGVAYYAELLLKNLKENQPYLNITPADILCVKVAGLCHDLGHGAFSHVFEVFMKRVSPNKKWHHERSSTDMLRYLLEKNQIKLEDYGLTPLDETFIMEIILGIKENLRSGRPAEKFFLYDIVNNSRSGLDVDKLDYFLRDIRHTNVNVTSVSFDRFFQLGRMLKAEPIRSKYERSSMDLYTHTPDRFSKQHRAEDAKPMYTICYPEKMVGEAVNLFAIRFQMHQKVYTHKSVKKVEYMLVDALQLADPFIRIPGSKSASHPDGLYKISECVFDPAALANLNDNIIYLIETSSDPHLAPAQEVLAKIRTRQFYECLGKARYDRKSPFDEASVQQITEDIVRLANEIQKKMTQVTPTPVKDNQGTEDNSDDPNIIEPDPNNPFSEDQFSFNPYAYQPSSYQRIEEDSLILSQDSFPPWVMQQRTVTHEGGANGHHSTNQLHRAHTTSSEPPLSQQSMMIAAPSSSAFLDPITTEDLIVEKMHIHYGLKEENPVNRLRFFSKNMEDRLNSDWDESLVAYSIKESQYETLLPRVFEDLAVRVFSRNSAKSRFLLEAFRELSRSQAASLPFPSFSQSQQV